jgi:hypothetical protein
MDIAVPLSKPELEKKIFSAYPEVFSDELKANGWFYPATIKWNDEQITEQIIGEWDFSYLLDLTSKFLSNVNGGKIIDLAGGFGVDCLIMGEIAKDIEIYVLDKHGAKIDLINEVLENYTFSDGKSGKDKITAIEGDIIDVPDFEFKFDGVYIRNIIGFLTSSKNRLEICNSIFNGVKKISHENTWLSIRDNDIDELTQDDFTDIISSTLGHKTESYWEKSVLHRKNNKIYLCESLLQPLFAIDCKVF